MVAAVRLPLEVFYERERRHPEKPYLVQPLGGGRVEALSWRAVGNQARRAATWLRGRDLPAGSRIAIISRNCAHWIVADLAIWMAGHVSVPLYPNLGAAASRQVLEHSGSALAFVGPLDDWPAMAPGIPEGVATVALPLRPEGRFDYLWDDLQACLPIDDSPCGEAGQLATIIYTSGTTGLPKGAMHSFGSIALATEGGRQVFESNEDDRLISYLPLSHVAERAFVEMGSLYGGQTLFFSEGLDTFIDDLRRARPTLMFGVPRIWSKFQSGVYGKIPAARLDFLLGLPLIGRRVGRQVLAGLGLDAVRMALSGAAPVPAELLRWYQKLGMELLEVYGMTENFGYSHVCRRGRLRPGWIGQANPGVEVRISQEGEVQLRSGATMQGYYRDAEVTAETITADGFLRTGDKGEEDADGYLRLTGRLKDIFKTSKGKYVAPAPIESRLAVSPLIEQVCVVGDNLPQPIALCILSELARRESRDGLQGHLRGLFDEVNQVLEKHERLLSLVLIGEAWSIESGFLTPTLKIKRNVVEGTYGPHFQTWLERGETVFWHD